MLLPRKHAAYQAAQNAALQRGCVMMTQVRGTREDSQTVSLDSSEEALQHARSLATHERGLN